MTAVWGPLGWMTLHSVASIYPEQPTVAEQQLVSMWLELFRDTITCHHCRSHFTEMFDLYRQKFPRMFRSRQEFMTFTFRAHNTVNRRLNKPIYSTVADCMDVLRNNVKNRTAREYRTAYLTHIRRYWSSMRDMSGIMAIKKINQMTQIENEYFVPRDTQFQVEFAEADVVLPRGTIDKIPESSIFPRSRPVPRSVPPPPAAAPAIASQPPRRLPTLGFRVTSSGLRLL